MILTAQFPRQGVPTLSGEGSGSLDFDAPPSRFGAYRVRAGMGEGRFGPIFLGDDPESGDRVVIRTFRAAADAGQRDALLSALRELCGVPLDHPAIARPLAADLDDDIVYFVHSYLDGVSAEDYVRAAGPQPLAEVAPRMTQVAAAIDFAAAVGIHHGDLTTRDVIVGPDGTGVSGFGLFQALQQAGLEVDGGDQVIDAADRDRRALVTVARELTAPADWALVEPIVRDLPPTALAFAAAVQDVANATVTASAAPPVLQPESPAAVVDRDAWTASEDLEPPFVRAHPRFMDPEPASEPPPPAVDPPRFIEPELTRVDTADSPALDVPIAHVPIGDVTIGDAPITGARIADVPLATPVVAARPSRELFAAPEPPRYVDTPNQSRHRPMRAAVIVALFVGLAAGFAGGFVTGRRGAVPNTATNTAAGTPANERGYTDEGITGAGRGATAGNQRSRVAEPTVDQGVGAGQNGSATEPGQPTASAPPSVPAPSASAVAPQRPSEPGRAATPVRPPPVVERPEPRPQGPGALFVDSHPSGAQVFVDGALVGRTPLLVSDVKPGPHAVRLALPMYRGWRDSVDVQPGTRTRVAASLEEQQ